MRLPQAEDGITGAIGALLLWSGRADELAELLKDTEEGPLPDRRAARRDLEPDRAHRRGRAPCSRRGDRST